MIAVPYVTGLFDVNENYISNIRYLCKEWSKFFKIGSSFAEVNADRTTPLTWPWSGQSIAICDVDRIGITSYDLEDKEITFDGPNEKSITVRLGGLKRKVLSGVAEDNLTKTKENIQSQRQKFGSTGHIITEAIHCNYMSVSLKIGDEQYSKEDSDENVIMYHLKKYSVDEEGNLHPTPQEPQNLRTEYEFYD